MKNIVVIICFLFLGGITTNLQSQDKKQIIKTNLEIGAKYTPFDYIGGIAMGIDFYKGRYGFSFRNDISFSILKKDSASYYGIYEYRGYRYLNFIFNFYKNSSVFLGIGLISRPDTIYGVSDFYSAYTVMSIGLFQKLSENIIFELRGDISLEKSHQVFEDYHAFPLSIAITYLLK